jgi:molybdopterin-guanine dinucleotide biosynthesis protein A
MSLRLARIFISPGHNYFGRHGMPADTHDISEVAEIECVAGRGLRGDRFFDFKPDYKGQATFFDLTVFRELLAHLHLPADTRPSKVRRNLFTEGVDLNALIGKEFTVQAVRFLGVAECSPCHWMDSALAPGAEEFLKGRGGLRCKILSDGILRAEDAPDAGLRIAGVVLAGGASTRMGEDKTFLEIGGETLVARQMRLLREAGCENIIISGRRGVDYSRSAGLRPAIENKAERSPAPPLIVHDAPGIEGPLAGILAAIDATDTSATHLITLPVDLPAMRAEVLRALLASCSPGYGAVAISPRGVEPLVAVLPREIFPDLRAAVAAGEMSPKSLYATPGIAERMKQASFPPETPDPFTNWNRPEDRIPPPD